jgi:hypothetical protein
MLDIYLISYINTVIYCLLQSHVYALKGHRVVL